MKKAFLIAAGMMLSAQSGYAQDVAEEEGIPFLNAMPVVLTATRLAQRPQDAPASVFVIDREMIEASGAREIADLLRLAPGFLVASVSGHQRTVGYNGFLDDYGRRLQVMVDGRSVYFPVFGGVRWSSLPLAIIDIERIEVIRGANSAAHGSNAFLGTVNFITRQPETVNGITAEILSGDPGMSNGILRYGFKTGHADSYMTLGLDSDEGFPDLVRAADVIERHDGKRLTSATFRSDYYPHARDVLGFSAGYKGGTVEDGVDEDPVKTKPLREVGQRQGYFQFHWDRTLDERAQINLTTYLNRFENDEHYTARDSGVKAIVVEDRSETRFGMELQLHNQLNDRLRTVVGGEFRRDRADAPTIFRSTDGIAQNDMFRLFGNAEWSIEDKFTINGGMTVERHDLTGISVSPRLGLNAHIDPRNTVRLTASRAHRVPSFMEAKADYYWLLSLDDGTDDVGDFIGFGLFGTSPHVIRRMGMDTPNLEPERVDGVELAYLFDLSRTAGLSGDIKLAFDHYSDMIFGYRVPVPDTGHPDLPDTYISADNTSAASANYVDFNISSLEFNLNIEPNPSFRVLLSAHFEKMSNLDVDLTPWQPYFDTIGTDPKILDESRGDVGTLLQSIPAQMFSLQAIVKPAQDWTASLMLQSVGAMRFLRTGDSMDPYTRIDFRLAKAFRNGSAHGEIEAVWQGFSEDYADFTNPSQDDGNLFENRFYLGLKLSR